MPDLTIREIVARELRRRTYDRYPAEEELFDELLDDIAAALAGWRPPPRRITEEIELVELPVRSILVREEDGDAIQKAEPDGYYWAGDTEERLRACEVADYLPALLVWTPGGDHA
jgi:hypothetical protein